MCCVWFIHSLGVNFAREFLVIYVWGVNFARALGVNFARAFARAAFRICVGIYCRVFGYFCVGGQFRPALRFFLTGYLPPVNKCRYCRVLYRFLVYSVPFSHFYLGSL